MARVAILSAILNCNLSDPTGHGGVGCMEMVASRPSSRCNANSINGLVRREQRATASLFLHLASSRRLAVPCALRGALVLAHRKLMSTWLLWERMTAPPKIAIWRTCCGFRTPALNRAELAAATASPPLPNR